MKNKQSYGFTVVEILVSIVIFGMLSIALVQSYISSETLYSRSKQLYEIYTVLSACPEIDRALQYDQVSGGINCFPNNTFAVEGGGIGMISYSPTLTVTETANLPVGDALRNVPNSKVINVVVNYPNNPAMSPWKIRLLISRNGIAQL